MGNEWSVNINEVMGVLFYAVLSNLRAECVCARSVIMKGVFYLPRWKCSGRGIVAKILKNV